MSELARIVRCYNLIKEDQASSVEALAKSLEVSESTVKRDVDVLRDELNIPIKFLRGIGYRIGKPNRQIGPRLEIPGLWLSAEEAYSLLTLINVLIEIDPRRLKKYVMPMREKFEKLVQSAGLKKQTVDHNDTDPLGKEFAGRIKHNWDISEAIINCRRLSLDIDVGDGKLRRGEFSPQCLSLTSKGWYLDALCHSTNKRRHIAMTDIRLATALDVPATTVTT